MTEGRLLSGKDLDEQAAAAAGIGSRGQIESEIHERVTTIIQQHQGARVIDLFEFCASDRFLAGGARERERHYTFPGDRPWTRRVVSARDYVVAVTRDPRNEGKKTSWHVLEEAYLRYFVGVIRDVKTFGIGPLIDDLERKRSEFSTFFGSVRQTKALAERIGQATGIDGERLYGETLMEMPYGHLRVVLAVQLIFPTITFPFITVLLDAYEEGLMPYGVFNGRLDASYAGPDVLLCVDPANLQCE